MKKKYITLFISLIPLCSCSSDATLKNCPIFKDEKFNATVVDISNQDFMDLGFSLGDSVSVYFSSHYSLKDVPYFNGYYVRNGEPVVVSYPSSNNLLITLNNIGIWSEANIDKFETKTVTIKMNKKGKYKATQEALGQSYSLDINDYDNEVEFANFRSLKGGNLIDNLIYRGASPLDNSRNRAKVVDNLLKENDIKTIIDLADSLDDINNYLLEEDFSSNYAKNIYENDNLIYLNMGSGYTTSSYKEAVVKGIRFMLSHDAPYYIHCMEGKDRTGFVCLLIEALLGATYEEMCLDYMTTYYNYYKISEELSLDKYNAVVNLYFDSFVEYLLDEVDKDILIKSSYVDSATRYLLDGGLTMEEITSFINKFSTK